jgi:hypothetical protein
LVDIIVKGLTYALEKPAERAAFVADGLSQFVSKLDATVAGAMFVNYLNPTVYIS